MSTGKALHCERMRGFPHDEKTLPKKVENGASHMSSKNLVVEPSLLDNCSWEKSNNGNFTTICPPICPSLSCMSGRKQDKTSRLSGCPKNFGLVSNLFFRSSWARVGERCYLAHLAAANCWRHGHVRVPLCEFAAVTGRQLSQLHAVRLCVHGQLRSRHKYVWDIMALRWQQLTSPHND